VESELEGPDFLESVGGKVFRVVFEDVSPDMIRAKIDGEERTISIVEETASFLVLKINGRALTFVRPPAILSTMERVPLPSAHHAGFLLSALPGLVISIDVSEGDEVEPGTPLVTIEAMKMESIIRSDRRARVGRIIVSKGEAVRKGQPLLSYE
jgi:propionyl-CoA carboxylase alpha subunit